MNLRTKPANVWIEFNEGEDFTKNPLYPIHMPYFSYLQPDSFDEVEVSYLLGSAINKPTVTVLCALAHWNQYCFNENEHDLSIFLELSKWLLEHEVSVGDSSVWPISLPPDLDTHINGLRLSALAQGCAISLLVRAYQFTHDEAFLEIANRAVRTFERDILDGGVCAPIGKSGIFFEEIAVYPASHVLTGCVFALIGLYDYVALTNHARIRKLIQRSLSTLHLYLNEFDAGFWTRADLLHRQFSSPDSLTLQIMLLEVLAKYSDCDYFSTVALRWKGYQQRFGSRLHYLIASHRTISSRALMKRMRTMLFPNHQSSCWVRVCIPVPAHPFTGGILTVLNGVAQVTRGVWQPEYLAQKVLPNPDGLIIHRFGTERTGPWQFPVVWLYFLAGFWKLVLLMRRGANYRVILPQDGVYTAAFAALAAKLAGVRVVCMDHAHLTLLKSAMYRAERIQTLSTRRWPRRLLSRLLLVGYWPSFSLFARMASSMVDHYFIPGVEGDGLEDICQQLGVQRSRITRFANMIDMKRHVIPDASTRAQLREKMGIAPDAIVIAMICRLSIEKGLDVAVESISQVLSTLASTVRSRVRIVIAGDGPMRQFMEEEVRKREHGQLYILFGEASPAEVISILGISDIFLYTSRRGVGYPLAILEAMASGCAVVASSVPLANSLMLAEGRGIVVPVEDVKATAIALTRLVNDIPLCYHMGMLARHYVATSHGETQLYRDLMRVTYWSGLDEILESSKRTTEIGDEPTQPKLRTVGKPSLSTTVTDADEPTQPKLQTVGRPSLSAIVINEPLVDKLITLSAPPDVDQAQKDKTQHSRGETYVALVRNLIKDSGIYAIGSIVSPLVSLLLAPFLTHRLSHTDYGVLAVLTTMIALMSGITQLGLKNAFFRAYSCDYESQRDRLGVISSVVVLLSLTSIPMAILAMITAPWLSTLLLGNAIFGNSIEITALVILIQNLTIPGMAWLRAENRAISYTVLSIASLLVNLGSAIVLVGMFNMGIAGALLAIGGGYLTIIIFTLPLLIFRAGLRLRMDIARNLLSFGIPLVFSFASYWILQLSDRYLLSRLGSLSQTASYAVAYTLGGALGTVILTPFSLAWPTAMFTIAKRKDAPYIFRLVFRWYSILLLLAAFALSLIATVALNLLFPPSYHSTSPVIPIIALSIVFAGVYEIFTIGIGIQRKTWFAFVFTTVAALTNVGLNLVLIPHYGSMGAAISTLLAYILMDLMAYALNQRIYHIPFEIHIFLFAILVGVAFYGGGNLLAQSQESYGAGLLYCCALGLYVGCLLLLGIFASRRDKERFTLEDSVK